MGDAFFKCKGRSCYKEMFHKLVGEHHAKKYPLGGCGQEEQKFHINALELLAVTLVLLTFTKGVTIKSIHFQINNKTALPYLLKIEGIGSSVLVRTNKEIWSILMSKCI